LGEAAFIAVERRQAKDTRQPQERAEQEQRQKRAPGRDLQEPGGFCGVDDVIPLAIDAAPGPV